MIAYQKNPHTYVHIRLFKIVRLFMLDTPAVCIVGASHSPLPYHVSRRGDGAGARVNPQCYSAQICQSKVPPHAGYHQCFDMHVVFG